MSTDLQRTLLYQRHVQDGARLVPFAGYEMPVQFPLGVLGEHRWTRTEAGLFDVSHMGPFQLSLTRPTGDLSTDHAILARAVEAVVSADVEGLKPGRVRYALLLSDSGGVLDDLMIARPPGGAGLYIVVNGAVKSADLAVFAAATQGVATIERLDDGGLFALQGPRAVEVLEAILPGVAALGFMDFRLFAWEGRPLYVSRSGYTGEDGFEILAPSSVALSFYEALRQDQRVQPIGLGARDSLRLEAGLPLYGHDLDDTVSPFEGAVGFGVSKRRLKAGDMRGAARLQSESAGELSRVRVGLFVLEGAPAREGADILGPAGDRVGSVTSGGFSPTLSRPIAMGFVPPDLAQPGQPLSVVVRGRPQKAEVAALPFVPHRYVRNA